MHQEWNMGEDRQNVGNKVAAVIYPVGLGMVLLTEQ